MQRDIVAELSDRPPQSAIGAAKHLLLFALTAAPTAWFVQTVANYSVISYACQGPTPWDPLSAATAAELWWVVWAVNLLAVALTVAAVAAAAVVWRRHRANGQSLSHALMEPGDPDRLFLAAWGVVGNLWFAGGVLFSTVALAIVPLCAS